MKNSVSNTPITGKVIIAFVIACTALFLAWYISKFTFREMLHTVENISAPNDKLTLVNHLSGRITRLDQLQRTMAIDKGTYHGIFFKEFGKLQLTLDTLSQLYKDNPIQAKRINLMKGLLLERNRLFLNYLNVRGEMVNNNVLSSQIKTLNGMLLSREKSDSTTILTSEQKVSTTTVVPLEKENKGFFARIFGKKNTNEGHGKIVNEELNIRIDTIAASSPDSTLKEVKQAMLSIKKKQLQQSERFVNRETELALAANNITGQMLGILQQVEEDVMNQSAVNNAQARSVVNSSVKYINIILITFLFLTAIFLYFILTDISRNNAYRKQLELAKEEAEYHSRAKQRFLSNMSHEIRTPLQTIIGYTELMMNGQAGKSTIDAIYHSSTHLLQIVNEILDYSRIISGKFSFNLSVFNLTVLLDEVVSVMRLPANNKSLHLVTDFDLSPSEFIRGDAFRLKQILYNILGNAIKFTEQGKITLSASGKHYDGYLNLMLSIQDTGIGIADEDLKRVFNEFDQGGVSTGNNVVSGSGLGLSIVKAITESQGGRIYVKSEAGKGTCFTLYMKFAIAEEKEIIQPESQIDSTFNGKVWIVDDDAFILQLCSAILTNHAIPHVCFNRPETVLETSWDNDVSCILLDMRMPGMNGAALCGLLRSRVPANVKIYALTAQALPEERAGVLSQGFDGLLMKPFREKELLQLIHSDSFLPKQDAPDINFPDFESLKKMTFGDEEQLIKILKRFTEDTETDIKLMATAITNQNAEEMSLLLHRIAGRTAQIGSKKLALDFRQLEIDSHAGVMDKEQLLTVKEKLNNLADLAKSIQKEVDAASII